MLNYLTFRNTLTIVEKKYLRSMFLWINEHQETKYSPSFTKIKRILRAKPLCTKKYFIITPSGSIVAMRGLCRGTTTSKCWPPSQVGLGSNPRVQKKNYRQQMLLFAHLQIYKLKLSSSTFWRSHFCQQLLVEVWISNGQALVFNLGLFLPMFEA